MDGGRVTRFLLAKQVCVTRMSMFALNFALLSCDFLFVFVFDVRLVSLKLWGGGREMFVGCLGKFGRGEGMSDSFRWAPGERTSLIAN